MHKKLVILITSLLLISGCSLSSSKITTKPIPKERESLAPETIAPLKQQIQYFVNFPERLYPKNVPPQDVDSTYELNRALFLFAFSTSTDNNSTVYLSTTRGKSWEPFLDTSKLTLPKKLSKPFIPVGMYTDETGSIFIDLKEQFPKKEPPALVRYETKDAGQTWLRVGCYTFSPSEYYTNQENTQKGIQPTRLSELKRCKK